MPDSETRKVEVYPNTFITIYKLGTKVCIDRGDPEDRSLKGFYIPSWLVGRAVDFIRKPKMGLRLQLSQHRYLGIEKIRAAAARKIEGFTFRVYSDGYGTHHWIHIPKIMLNDIADTLKEYLPRETETK